MYKVDRAVFTRILTNLSGLITELTGTVVPPPEIEHHAATIEMGVDRSNKQQPSSPKIIGGLKPKKVKYVTNVDGNTVVKGSERDDRWGPGGTEVVKKKRGRS